MNEQIIDLAEKMLMYCVFSDEEVKNATPKELTLKLRYFFSQEVLDEAIKRITTKSKVE